MTSICTLPAGATLAVQFAEGGRVFRGGDRVELDAEPIPGLTWREALGEHAAFFTDEEPAPPADVPVTDLE